MDGKLIGGVPWAEVHMCGVCLFVQSVLLACSVSTSGIGRSVVHSERATGRPLAYISGTSAKDVWHYTQLIDSDHDDFFGRYVSRCKLIHVILSLVLVKRRGLLLVQIVLDEKGFYFRLCNATTNLGRDRLWAAHVYKRMCVPCFCFLDQ